MYDGDSFIKIIHEFKKIQDQFHPDSCKVASPIFLRSCSVKILAKLKTGIFTSDDTTIWVVVVQLAQLILDVASRIAETIVFRMFDCLEHF